MFGQNPYPQIREQGGNVNIYGDVTLVSSQSFGRQTPQQQMIQNQQQMAMIGMMGMMVNAQQQNESRLIEAKRLELEERKIALAEKAVAQGYLLESDMPEIKNAIGIEDKKNPFTIADKSEVEEVENAVIVEDNTDGVYSPKKSEEHIEVSVACPKEVHVEGNLTFDLDPKDASSFRFGSDFYKPCLVKDTCIMIKAKDEFNWKKKVREAIKEKFPSLKSIPRTIIVFIDKRIIFIRNFDSKEFIQLNHMSDEEFTKAWGVYDIVEYLDSSNQSFKESDDKVYFMLDLNVDSAKALTEATGGICPIVSPKSETRMDMLVEQRSFFADKPYLITAKDAVKLVRRIM